MTFAGKAISYFEALEFRGSLPAGISIMNPFRENPEVLPLISQFFSKFYSDNKPRHLILGINPGRFGAGSTGIPFTDTQRLERLGLAMPALKTFEPSSAFIYEMIDAYGGPGKFYSDFYISAISPLGFTKTGRNNQINYNYYDSKELIEALSDFIKNNLEQQLEFGILKNVCFCLGTGKNYRFLLELNKSSGYFDRIVPLEHPRFIMQYKSKQKERYISKYIEELRKA